MKIIPSLLAKDINETIEFYAKHLGFNLTGSDPIDCPSWIELERDGVALQFYSDPPLNTLDSPAFSGSFYLHCDDIRPFEEKLSSSIKVVWGPESMPYGVRELALEDPNGYILVLAQPES